METPFGIRGTPIDLQYRPLSQAMSSGVPDSFPARKQSERDESHYRIQLGLPERIRG